MADSCYSFKRTRDTQPNLLALGLLGRLLVVVIDLALQLLHLLLSLVQLRLQRLQLLRLALAHVLVLRRRLALLEPVSRVARCRNHCSLEGVGQTALALDSSTKHPTEESILLACALDLAMVSKTALQEPLQYKNICWKTFLVNSVQIQGLGKQRFLGCSPYIYQCQDLRCQPGSFVSLDLRHHTSPPPP
ncbi:hypothetical protein DL89DRAFT_152741 [Linderina pennispora]|uniref:Uncharacterized protein n=1 Tax=Linderina pennispora TaxID=61395 RepID=A0A1Y1W9Z5_9FUNG|nr:uncharacterized protein DL89DRAFT_152741 [Linderina pennispora]ORX70138.1 hypothetical protein DL89DRAFT_152741 [Linderina pennispora]